MAMDMAMDPTGNSPDAFPLDGSQWDDQDGDGYGDNPNGNASDAFPFDSSQWSDQDGDGYGDNATGNYADQYPADSTQWEDSDADGYGDNHPPEPTVMLSLQILPSGLTKMVMDTEITLRAQLQTPSQPIQHNGLTKTVMAMEIIQPETTVIAFPADSTQWADQDSDGYGDNQKWKRNRMLSQWMEHNGKMLMVMATETTKMETLLTDSLLNQANGSMPTEMAMETTRTEILLTTASIHLLDKQSIPRDAVLNRKMTTWMALPMTLMPARQRRLEKQSMKQDVPALKKMVTMNGIMDAFDACPMTPLGASVDAAGCADTQT